MPAPQSQSPALLSIAPQIPSARHMNPADAIHPFPDQLVVGQMIFDVLIPLQPDAFRGHYQVGSLALEVLGVGSPADGFVQRSAAVTAAYLYRSASPFPQRFQHLFAKMLQAVHRLGWGSIVYPPGLSSERFHEFTELEVLSQLPVVHRVPMQLVTPIVVPIAVRMAISNCMAYLKSSFFFIISIFLKFQFLLFILSRRGKNESRKAADCTSAAKIVSFLPKRCKTTPFGALIGAALLTVKTRNLFTLLQ